MDDGDFPDIFGGDNFSYNDHLEQDFPAGASLKVIDTHGAVSVRASDDNKITVVVRKRIGADNQNDADKYNQQTKPTITVIGGLVTVDAKAEAAGDHPCRRRSRHFVAAQSAGHDRHPAAAMSMLRAATATSTSLPSIATPPWKI